MERDRRRSKNLKVSVHVNIARNLILLEKFVLMCLHFVQGVYINFFFVVFLSGKILQIVAHDDLPPQQQLQSSTVAAGAQPQQQPESSTVAAGAPPQQQPVFYCSS